MDCFLRNYSPFTEVSDDLLKAEILSAFEGRIEDLLVHAGVEDVEVHRKALVALRDSEVVADLRAAGFFEAAKYVEPKEAAALFHDAWGEDS